VENNETDKAENLEFHQVRVLAAGEAELLLQVALHEGIGADGLQEAGINGLLVGLALLGGLDLVVREPLISKLI